MKKVITYGTFDVFHYGHFSLLERAKSFGDHLTVCVSTDKFNTLKKKHSHMNFAQRVNILKHISLIDDIRPEKNWEQKITDIVDLKIDIFVIGDDWKGHFDFLKEHCEVRYLPRTITISSSKIREIL
jgi:glycerol-3-phosphate cytidylyltransferase